MMIDRGVMIYSQNFRLDSYRDCFFGYGNGYIRIRKDEV